MTMLDLKAHLKVNTIIVILYCFALSGCENTNNNTKPSTKLNNSPEILRPLRNESSNQETPKPTVKYPLNVMKNIALETCKSSVIATLYVPTSFNQDIAKTSLKITENKGITIKIPFTAITGDGQKTSQTAYCVTDSSGEVLMLNITK